MVNVGELETNSRMIYPFTITDAEDDWFTCKLKIDDEHGEDKDHDEFLLTNSSRTCKLKLRVCLIPSLFSLLLFPLSLPLFPSLSSPSPFPLLPHLSPSLFPLLPLSHFFIPFSPFSSPFFLLPPLFPPIFSLLPPPVLPSSSPFSPFSFSRFPSPPFVPSSFPFSPSPHFSPYLPSLISFWWQTKLKLNVISYNISLAAITLQIAISAFF